MPEQDPYYFKLDTKLQDSLNEALIRLCFEVPASCYDRDEDLRALRDQLECQSQPTPNQPWPGSCQIESNIGRELHTTLTAAIYAAAKQPPYVCLESVEKEDIDRAPDVETYMNIKAQKYDYDSSLYNAIYLALESRYCPMFIGYDQEVTRSFKEAEAPTDADGQPIPQDEPQILMDEKPGEPHIVFRCPDPWDFYVYPVLARGPQISDGATLVMERMYMTQEDLMLGVLYHGYDEDAVNDMLTHGPSEYNIDFNTLDRYRDGMSPENFEQKNEAGMWECYALVGRSPLLPDDNGEPTIPDALLHADCHWMVCPSANAVFKQCYSYYPNGLRPYALYHAIQKPNRMLGEGLMSVISQIQDEMTAITRFGIDNMNLEASPVMTAAESWLTRYSKWTIRPGRIMPRMSGDPIGLKPLQWDVKSQSLIMPWLGMLDATAHRFAASEGINSSLAGKERKAAEIHFAEQVQQTKFDLFLANIQRGIKETFRIMMAIILHNMDASDTVREGQEEVTVTPEDLEKKYRFIPQASTDAVSPASRLARQQAIAQIVIQYWQGTVAPPFAQQIGYWYALNHRLLVMAGERSPERYIGPDPSQQPQQPGMVPGMMPGMQPPNMGASMLGPPQDNGAGMLQASPFSPRGNGSSY